MLFGHIRNIFRIEAPNKRIESATNEVIFENKLIISNLHSFRRKISINIGKRRSEFSDRLILVNTRQKSMTLKNFEVRIRFSRELRKI